MKKLFYLFSGIILSFNLSAQPLFTSGLCGPLVSFIPTSGNVTIPVNFIFFQPISGTGKFDTITRASCDSIIRFMNYKWSHLRAPSLPLPSPYTADTNYKDSKIRFSFKSISFKPDAQYGTNGSNSEPQPDFIVTDPNALNIVFNINNNGAPAGRSIHGSNLVRTIQASSPGSFGLFDNGTAHTWFLHEVGHALGLGHTYPEQKGFLNPSGTILPPYPVDDFWLEDSITQKNYPPPNSANNFMGETFLARDYLSPKQIGFIHYMLKMHPVVNAMVAQSCTLGVDWSMNSGTYSSPIFADADLIIPQGNHVIFTGCVFMKAGARIIIEPGGKLTINGGKISHACNTPWKGIEVQSNAGAIQTIDPLTLMPNSSVGMLELKKSAEIEGAEIAINVGKYNSSGTYFIAGGVTFPGSYIPNTGAGIIYCDSSTFTNNRIAVNFNPYYVLAPGGGNKSYFKSSRFYSNVDYTNSNNPFAVINLNTTFGIKILGCQFTDSFGNAEYGIRSLNGSIIVKDESTGVTQTRFQGFKYAIYLSNWLTTVPSAPSQIRHVLINQQGAVTRYGGIYVLGNFGTEIVNCTINISQPLSATGRMSYAIYLDGCDGYIIENNTLNGASNAYLTGGIFVNNSGLGANSIYNNILQNFQQGIWAQNINYDYNSTNGPGLKMNCNGFTSCRFNIGVQSAYSPACAGIGCPPVPFQIGGVSTTQGVTLLTDQDNVRNTYGAPNCPNENLFYVNTQNSFSTLHGSFTGIQYHVPSPCSNPLKVLDYSGGTPSGTRTQWCPTSQFQNHSSSVLTSNISTNRANINSLTGDFIAKEDGADQGGLLGLISTIGISVNEVDVRDVLIGKDFLSDPVLIAYFLASTDSVFLTDVFAKNAPVSTDVWTVLTDFGLDPPLALTLQQIQFEQNRISDREALRSQITLARNELGLLNNEKIRRFLNDTTGPIFDSIAAIYALNEIPNSDFKLLDLAIATDHSIEVDDLMSSLSLISGNEDLCTVLTHVNLLRQDPAYASTMLEDEDLYDYLQSKRGSDHPMLDTYIKGLLESVYDEKIEEVTLQPEGVDPDWGDERKAYSQPEEKSTIVGSLNNKFIKVFPNPASERLTIENQDSEGPVQINITDLTGKSFIKQRCDKQCVIDVSSLSNGIYLLNLYQQDKFLSSKKLVIIK